MGYLIDHDVSVPFDQREVEIVTLFLKHHPQSTADEIAEETKMTKIAVYYCLFKLEERGVVKVTETEPQRWVLK